ncbi:MULTISPECIES: DUF3311 domain-containing protein [Streptomyces]|uniref:DUF3311 domain-containing protein n=1 Tax=Streptomyces roseoviridis TaxID=67361 RepID=A0ABV5QRF6_9ACTN
MRRLLAIFCLAAPFAGILWVSSYARITPTLLGIPFFYWYQMLWIPVAAGLTALALVLLRRDRRTDSEGTPR